MQEISEKRIKIVSLTCQTCLTSRTCQAREDCKNWMGVGGE